MVEGNANDSSDKNIPEASNVGEELNIEPHVGMEFESIKKAREFYISFAKKRGFGVRIRSTKPKRAVLICCNEGQHQVKSAGYEEIQDSVSQTKRKCSTTRSGCQASLIVSRGTTQSSWFIQSFNNDHNHVMVSPRSVSYMRCHKKMTIAAKNLVERFEEEGLPTGKIPSHFILQRWTKDANKGIKVNYTEDNLDGQSNTSRIIRRMHAQQEASMLVDLAEESEELYKFIISELSHTCKLAIAMKTNSLIGDEITLLDSSQNLNNTCISEQGNEPTQLPIGHAQ
ncbi:FAR1 DNA-binding domain [Sesbania bispinosa]|nr:FAR1 DNA-binding domain [Sesbania bispinosa]